VILVDDVYTTGSTVNEIARVLKLAGCRRVEVLTGARVSEASSWGRENYVRTDGTEAAAAPLSSLQ
jgi:adenine/guanine phosphoribosyltransferase-like PRPP-binding protein